MSAPTPGRSAGIALWWDAIHRDRKAGLGAAVLAVFGVFAIFGPMLVGDPQALVGIPLQPPSLHHLFGTTGQGQDVFAQLVVGTRVSLSIGFGVGFAVVLVGALVGVTAEIGRASCRERVYSSV